jgi:hypothetical protein
MIRNDLKLLADLLGMVDQLRKALRTDSSIKSFVAENHQRTFVFTDTAIETLLCIGLLTHRGGPFDDGSRAIIEAGFLAQND